MSYVLNLGIWNKIFAVPAEIVDKHIKLAGAAQLKVLLWTLRHAGEAFSDDDIAAALSMNKADVSDSMQYWIETGVVVKNENILAPMPLENNSLQTAPVQTQHEGIERNIPQILAQPPIPEKNEPKSVKVQRPEKPDAEYLAKRITSDKSIAFLMQQADNILGRMTSNSDKATLLLLNEYDGLPPEVIIMMLQYLKSIGKTNMSYIQKVGIAWGEKEIVTVEKAEQEITRLTQGRSAVSIVQRTLGLDTHSPTDREIATADRWINEWHFSAEMIREAYEICVNAKGKYIPKYVDSILSRWHSANITTVEQARKEQKPHNKKNENTYKAAYNLSEYENSSIFDE